MSRPKIVAVVNMHSGKAQEASKKLQACFAESQCNIEHIYLAQHPAELPKLYKKALKHQPDVMVLGGGDGTLITGIEFLVKEKFKGKVGLLPLGTANYLARNLSIPLDIAQAIKVIQRGKATTIPLGVANGTYFALTLTIGLTEKLSKNVSNTLKRKSGQLAYALELLKQSVNHKAFDYAITSPQLKKTLRGTTHQILIYNSDINVQFKLAPPHSLPKRTLKLVVYKSGRSVMKLYASFLLHVLSFGKIQRGFDAYELTEASIETRPHLPASYDGEVHSTSPYAITLEPSSVQILT